jgi:hypothetical protein
VESATSGINNYPLDMNGLQVYMMALSLLSLGRGVVAGYYDSASVLPTRPSELSLPGAILMKRLHQLDPVNTWLLVSGILVAHSDAPLVPTAFDNGARKVRYFINIPEEDIRFQTYLFLQVESEKAPTVLYFHTHGEKPGALGNDIQRMVKDTDDLPGVNVVLLDFTGYGLADHEERNEANMIRNAHVSVDPPSSRLNRL